MRLYPRIQTFLHQRLFDGLFARFVGILIIDILLIQTIGSKAFDNFLETFKYYFDNYFIGAKFISCVKFSMAGSFSKYLVPFVLIILWLFNQRQLLKMCFYLYLCWVNSKFLIAMLFLVFGLWNPTASGLDYLVLGCLAWVTNVLIFATWYWLIDRDHQKLFIQDKTVAINFLFIPTTSDLPRYQSWVPSFFDYLFLAFNTSISFSQSNTGYLTKKGRILTMLQALIALIINVIIIARAVSLIR